jgi:hypothetical protein
MSLRGTGWNGAEFNDSVNADSVQPEGYADENFSSTDDGGRFAIRTIQDGTNSGNDFRFVIDGRGNACIGNSCANATSNLAASTTLEVYDASGNAPGVTHLLIREGGSQTTKMAKKTKNTKKVAAAKRTTKKPAAKTSAAKKSAKTIAAKRAPATKAPASRAKVVKSAARKPTAKTAMTKTPHKKPVAAVTPAAKPLGAPPKPAMPVGRGAP